MKAARSPLSDAGLSSPDIEHLDARLERVTWLRERLARDVDAVNRAQRIALLCDAEARLWSQVFELSPYRLVWRAALRAEALARREARIWQARAAQPPDSETDRWEEPDGTAA